VAVPVLALFMPPVEVVVLSSAMAFTLSLLSVRSFSSVISLGEIKPLLLMSAAGTVLGVFILKLIPAELFQLCVGVAVLIASMGLMASGTPVSLHVRGSSWLAGLLSGLMNGALAIPGPPIIIYAMVTELDPIRSRALLMAFFLASSAFALIAYAVAGVIELQSVKYYLLSMPALVGGDWLGSRLFDRYGRSLYRKVALLALAALGVSITLRALL
jgi:uncharacterized membrane protein YfcA